MICVLASPLSQVLSWCIFEISKLWRWSMEADNPICLTIRFLLPLLLLLGKELHVSITFALWSLYLVISRLFHVYFRLFWTMQLPKNVLEMVKFEVETSVVGWKKCQQIWCIFSIKKVLWWWSCSLGRYRECMNWITGVFLTWTLASVSPIFMARSSLVKTSWKQRCWNIVIYKQKYSAFISRFMSKYNYATLK